MNAAQQPTLMRIPMRTLSRQTRYALEGVDDILVYKVAMTTRFRGVTRREGLLLHGHAGWGEAAPFWNYDDLESSRWLAAALESARRFPPVPRRKFVPVNVTIPVISPEEAYERVKASGGCATAKIKVAEPGVSVGRDCARIAAVADALRETVGGQATIRLDANGAWEVDQAREAIPAMAAAAGVVPIEYVEQPCLTVDELAQVRRSVDVPIAADESIRRAEDPLEVARKEAADVVIIKVAPLGGVRAALKVARKSGLGVVVSSALETSVGLSVGVAAAAAVPGVPRRRTGHRLVAGGRRDPAPDSRAWPPACSAPRAGPGAHRPHPGRRRPCLPLGHAPRRHGRAPEGGLPVGWAYALRRYRQRYPLVPGCPGRHARPVLPGFALCALRLRSRSGLFRRGCAARPG